MNFEKDFDAGQNNTYNEVNFGPNSQYLPNVTELTIINNGTSGCKSGSKFQKDGKKNDVVIAPIRAEILTYVERIRSFLADEWKQGYVRFWEGILDLEIIAGQVYKKGKQQGTNFNRNLVCKIIHYLERKNMYRKDYNASEITRVLEGDDQHSIRTTALCHYPDAEICSALDNYIEDFKL